MLLQGKIMAYEKYCQETDESWEKEKQIKVD